MGGRIISGHKNASREWHGVLSFHSRRDLSIVELLEWLHKYISVNTDVSAPDGTMKQLPICCIVQTVNSSGVIRRGCEVFQIEEATKFFE